MSDTFVIKIYRRANISELSLYHYSLLKLENEQLRTRLNDEIKKNSSLHSICSGKYDDWVDTLIMIEDMNVSQDELQQILKDDFQYVRNIINLQSTICTLNDKIKDLIEQIIEQKLIIDDLIAKINIINVSH
jgi:hypothetical protein